MTKTALENRKLSHTAEIEANKLKHDAAQRVLDRKQRDKESKRATAASIIGGILGAGGKVISGAMGKNDPSWYKNWVTNLETFVNVPTYDRLGSSRIPKKLFKVGSTFNNVPGIMVFPWLPTVGPQRFTPGRISENPINQTLSRAKEKVLALNSRSNVNWEPSDLGFNVMCSADIMAGILELGRVIKVYNTYHAKNAYLASALIAALGWSYSDIVANYAEYRKTYTLFAKRFNSSIVAPSDMSLFKRRAYLAGNVFIDTEDKASPRQLYAFRQHAWFELSADGSKCELSTDGTSTIYNFQVYFGSRIESITSNPDFIEMYQDLRHAFGDNIVQIPECVDAEEIEFNAEPLNREQIHNLRTFPIGVYNSTPSLATVTLTEWELHQDTSGYLFQGNTSPDDRCIRIASDNPTGDRDALAQFYTDGHVFNVHKDECSGDDVLDITRLAFTMVLSTYTNNVLGKVDGCGTEVVVRGIVFYFDDASALQYSTFVSYAIGRSGLAASYYQHLAMSALASAFDWSPIMVSIYVPATGSVDHMYTYMDARLTFTIYTVDLWAIHDACVLSEFYTPTSNYRQ